MASQQQQVREWSGINTFAPATQTKLLELLGKLKQEVLFLFIEQIFMFLVLLKGLRNCLQL